MKVSVEDVSSVKKIMHIAVPQERVAKAIDKAYVNLKKTAKIKGFRQGKVPRTVLERMFQKDVRADVRSELLQESFIAAIEETKLNIVGNPVIDPPEVDADSDYVYDATVEIPPVIDDIEWKGLALKKTLYAASDGEIDAQLAMLRQRLAQKVAIEENRVLRDDDYAQITYEGFFNGRPYEATQRTENHILHVGLGEMTPAFDEQILGMEKGDTRKFKITFPPEYKNPNLAARDIDFEVTLNEIRVEVLPEINDDMAKKLGQFEDLDALKAAIRVNLTEGYQKRIEQELNEQIFLTLIERTTFEVPETMVEQELEAIVNEAEQSFTYHNMTLDQVGLTRESLKEKYKDTAEKQVRRHIILSKIIDQEKLEVSDEALEKGFQQMADTYQQPIDGIKAYYNQNGDKLAVFKHTLLEKQAIQIIVDNSQISEVEPEKAETDEQAPDSTEE
ncbi:MAG: trigger factor [Pseudomonadota bacterium]